MCITMRAGPGAAVFFHSFREEGEVSGRRGKNGGSQKVQEKSSGE
jgi:hypothetical protein